MSWLRSLLRSRAAATVAAGGRAVGDVAHKVAEVRRALGRVVAEVNRTTDDETRAAYDSLSPLADRAREQLGAFRGLLDDLRGDQAVTPAIEAHSTSLQHHVEELRRSVEENDRQVRATVKQVQTILDAVKEISKLTRESKILAINARIEAARGGSAASGFAIIASDMQRLSNAVAAANDDIQKVAAGMSKELPAMVRSSAELSQRSEAFSLEATESLGEISRRSDALQEAIHQTLTGGDEALAQTVEAVEGALGHLQFNDANSRKLAQLEWALQDLETELARGGAGGGAPDGPPGGDEDGARHANGHAADDALPY